MISVEDAWERILKTVSPLPAESVEVTDALNRTLAEDIISKRTTPPSDISAMDGYAVAHSDLANIPATLKVIGEAPAGTPFDGAIKPGETVRIFTGGVVPAGADTVVIQENTERDGDNVTILEPSTLGKNIRKAGMDFAEGDVLVKAGKPLNERDIALIAGGNHGNISVAKRPKVALLANGDELVAPGGVLKDGSVINTNTPALKALIETTGAEVTNAEILPDDLNIITKGFQDVAVDADVIVTLGGASVGDYDYVLPAFQAAGGTMDFWKIAMKPGKPLMFGEISGKPVLGLPGNPNSAYVTAFLFLLPVLRALQGQNLAKPHGFPARAAGDVPEAYDRELFLLAALSFDQETGAFLAKPHPRQDSARMASLQASDCLIRRKPFQKSPKAGDLIEVLPLPTC